MLPFGSLISEIPLLVLAFAYMLFFGTYALNKSKASDISDPGTDKVERVKYSPAEPRSDTFYYNDFTVEKQAESAEKHDIACFPDQNNYLIRHIPNDKISSNFCEFSLFSRPPPIFS